MNFFLSLSLGQRLSCNSASSIQMAEIVKTPAFSSGSLDAIIRRFPSKTFQLFCARDEVR